MHKKSFLPLCKTAFSNLFTVYESTAGNISQRYVKRIVLYAKSNNVAHSKKK